MAIEAPGPTDGALLYLPDDHLRTRFVLHDLNAFANRNPRFASREITRFDLTLSEEEAILTRIDPDFYDPQDELERFENGDALDDMEPGKVTMNYQFSAEWLLINNRFFRGYSFGVTADSTANEMPVTIAQEAYPGLSPEDAIKACGPTIISRSLSFNVSTFNRKFNMCESNAFLDAYGQMIGSACTCHVEDQHDPIYIVPHSEDGDEEGSLLFDEPVVQRVALDTYQRLESEKIEVQTPEQALAEWVALAAIDKKDPTKDSAWHEQSVRLGLGTLHAIERALQGIG